MMRDLPSATVAALSSCHFPCSHVERTSGTQHPPNELPDLAAGPALRATPVNSSATGGRWDEDEVADMVLLQELALGVGDAF